MTVRLLVPLAVAVAAAFTLTGLHRHVRPDLAARALTVALLGAFVATSQVLAALALGSVSHLPGLHGAVEWCRHALGVHASVGPVVGATSVVVLAVAVFRTHRVLRSWWSVRRAAPGAPELVDSDELFAFSLPGPSDRSAHHAVTGIVAIAPPTGNRRRV